MYLNQNIENENPTNYRKPTAIKPSATTILKGEGVLRVPLQNVSRQTNVKITAAEYFRKKTDNFPVYQDEEEVKQSASSTSISEVSICSNHSQISRVSTSRAECSSSMSISTQSTTSEFSFDQNFSVKYFEEEEDENADTVENDLDDLASDYMSVRSAESSAVMRYDALDRCPDYSVDIFAYNLHREKKFFNLVRQNYMDKQKQLDARMRMILIEWIIDVVAEFKLSQTTLHLVVSILDRVLSNIECPRTKFQLVGATCVFIAGKSEDMVPALVADCVYIMNKQYTQSDIFTMERIILSVIDFNINVPLPYSFLNYFLVFRPLREKVVTQCMAFLDLSALHLEFIRFMPSRIGAGCYVMGVYLNGTPGLRLSPEKRIKENFTSLKTSSREIPDEDRVQLTKILLTCWPEELVEKTKIPRDELIEVLFTLGFYENLIFSTQLLPPNSVRE